jgi:maleylpyruvate isomerase
MKLYNQCRSGPSYRVRIALALKSAPYEYIAVDLRAGAQRSGGFLAVNPQGLVPALEVEGRILTQSAAIIEWLDETRPDPPLFPADPWERAVVRGMAAVIGSDIQPLNNMRVQAYLRGELSLDEAQVGQWVHRWIGEGFAALEKLVDRHGAGWCFGDAPTVADIYLAPQAVMAARLGFDITPFARLSAVVDRCAAHPAFAAAHPSNQPDWS